MHEIGGWLRRRGLSMVGSFWLVMALLGVVSSPGCKGQEAQASLRGECMDARWHTAHVSVHSRLNPQTPRERRIAEQHTRHHASALGQDFLASCERAGSKYTECVAIAESSADIAECAKTHGGPR